MSNEHCNHPTYRYECIDCGDVVTALRAELAAEREKARIAVKGLEEAEPRLRKAYDAFGAAGVHWALAAIAAVKS